MKLKLIPLSFFHSRPWIAHATAFLLGCSLTLAFAPFEIFPFAILAPAGLLALWLTATPQQAFRLGFSFGLGLFSTGVYWIHIAIHQYGGSPLWLAILITAALVIYLAFYPAIVGYLLNRHFRRQNASKILAAFPALWVISEWIRNWFLTGFPWLYLGYSQTSTPLKNLATIYSVFGVSLAVAMCSGLVVFSVIQWQQRNYRQLYFNLFSFLMIWISAALLGFTPWTHPVGKPLTISLVQGNIPQSVKWSPEHIQLSFDRYEQLSEPLWGKSNIIIWPEAAIPLPLQKSEDFINYLDEKANTYHSTLILGIPIKSDTQEAYYNAIASVGSSRDVYLKRRLVPFGEYTPLTEQFPNLFNFLHIPLGETAAGGIEQEPMVVDGIKILPGICYEVAFPGIFYTDNSSVGLLLTVTNDAWFGESSAQAQHLQMAMMRAIEMQRPLLFASNNGITAIINANGSLENIAPAREIYVLNGTAQPMQGLTPWMQFGFDPLFFTLFVMLIRALFQQYRDYRREKKNAIKLNELPNESTK